MVVSQKVSEILQECGLDAKEIKVYITLLKKQNNSAQEISKLASLNRTTTYHILQRLAHKGFVTTSLQGKVTYFSAISATQVSLLLENKRKLVDSIIPDLNALSTTEHSKLNVQVYRGSKGIRSILLNILECQRSIKHYGDATLLEKRIPYIFPQYINQRIEKKITIKIITQKDTALKNNSKKLRSFKFTKKHIPSIAFIYGSNLALLQLESEPYSGVIISDAVFAKMQETMFDLLWDSL
jgi:sugar-specific transcriptional regulator TrmB